MKIVCDWRKLHCSKFEILFWVRNKVEWCTKKQSGERQVFHKKPPISSSLDEFSSNSFSINTLPNKLVNPSRFLVGPTIALCEIENIHKINIVCRFNLSHSRSEWKWIWLIHLCFGTIAYDLCFLTIVDDLILVCRTTCTD